MKNVRPDRKSPISVRRLHLFATRGIPGQRISCEIFGENISPPVCTIGNCDDRAHAAIKYANERLYSCKKKDHLLRGRTEIRYVARARAGLK